MISAQLPPRCHARRLASRCSACAVSVSPPLSSGCCMKVSPLVCCVLLGSIVCHAVAAAWLPSHSAQRDVRGHLKLRDTQPGCNCKPAGSPPPLRIALRLRDGGRYPAPILLPAEVFADHSELQLSGGEVSTHGSVVALSRQRQKADAYCSVALVRISRGSTCRVGNAACWAASLRAQISSRAERSDCSTDRGGRGAERSQPTAAEECTHSALRDSQESEQK